MASEPRNCEWCKDALVSCPACGSSVHLDELVGNRCIICDKAELAKRLNAKGRNRL